MKTLKAAQAALRISESLMKLNQESYVRAENGTTPIGVNWNLEKQHEMFNALIALRDELTTVVYDLNQLM
jgi:hypothetical protein